MDQRDPNRSDLDLEPLDEDVNDVGVMEFFDWLAGTGSKELYTVAGEHGLTEFDGGDGIKYTVNPAVALSGRQREALGKAVWACM